MNLSRHIRLASVILTVASLSACSTPGGYMSAGKHVDQADVPSPVRVPAGHHAFLHTVGKGELTYECREKKDQAGMFAWAFAGPVATLSDARGNTVGRYYGGPTWESTDGSKVTGKQLATSPGTPGSIPLQLVQAHPASGQGAMQGVSYIQRLATMGGTAAALPCGAAQKGQKHQVGYQARYIFYRPAM